MPFCPTHKITLTSSVGELEDTILVMDADGEGALYTEEEWDACANADWTLDDTGALSFQGAPRPGRGNVEIEQL